MYGSYNKERLNMYSGKIFWAKINSVAGAGQMGYWLRTLDVFPEDQLSGVIVWPL